MERSKWVSVTEEVTCKKLIAVLR